jgi:hypothetical protein
MDRVWYRNRLKPEFVFSLVLLLLALSLVAGACTGGSNRVCPNPSNLWPTNPASFAIAVPLVVAACTPL